MSVLVLVAFGVTLYAMSVILTEGAAGGEYSITLLSAGFGGTAIVAGLLAPAVGRYADDHSVRGIMLLGAAMGAIAMVVFARSRAEWHVLVAFWVLLGPSAAMTLYEPAYVAIGQWVSDKDRNKAIALLSLIGGLAGPVFVPLTGFLVDRYGWRVSSVMLGGIFLFAGVIAVTTFPEYKPKDHRERAVQRVSWTRFLRERRLLYLTAAVVLTFAAMNSVFFHRVAVFEEQGFALATIAILAGLSGLLTFPGRYFMPRVAEHIRATTLFTIACSGLVVSMVFAIKGTPLAAMVAFFVIFGLFFGILLPTRAVIMNGWYAGEDYGAVMGKQWAVAAVVGGATPVLVGASRDALGSYTWPLVGLTGLIAVAALFNIAAACQPETLSTAPGNRKRRGVSG